MTLTARELRMLRSLPAYYWESEEVLRMVQAAAAEFDRMHARVDAIVLGMIPGAADDSLGFLSLWERRLGLPVAPAGVSVPSRQEAVRAKIRALDAVTAADVLQLMADVAGAAVTVQRNTPGQLQDTITAPVTAGSHAGGRLAQVVDGVWPAHRQATINFSP